MIDPQVITVELHGQIVGQVVSSASGMCAFQYDPSYLQLGQSISPLALPLTNSVMVAKPEPFRGISGSSTTRYQMGGDG